MVKLYIVYSVICDITILLGLGYLIFNSQIIEKFGLTKKGQKFDGGPHGQWPPVKILTL